MLPLHPDALMNTEYPHKLHPPEPSLVMVERLCLFRLILRHERYELTNLTSRCTNSGPSLVSRPSAPALGTSELLARLNCILGGFG